MLVPSSSMTYHGKLIPEALPETYGFQEQRETVENKRDLEQVMDAAVDAVTQDADTPPPVLEAPDRERRHLQER